MSSSETPAAAEFGAQKCVVNAAEPWGRTVTISPRNSDLAHLDRLFDLGFWPWYLSWRWG